MFILLVLSTLLFIGCQQPEIEELAQERLFSISFGKMEDQIDLFQIGDLTYGTRDRIVIKDGLVYVANGNSGKIMEFSSYGDIVFLLYNPSLNPEPVLLKSGVDEGKLTTKIAAPYPFRSVGLIGVNSSKDVYVEDIVPEERVGRDADRGVVLNRTILRFDRYGRLVHGIGQEGVGGTPFAYVEGIHVTDRDELVVITRYPRAWVVHWYSVDDELLYEVEIDSQHLPANTDENIFPSLEKIVPDSTDHMLYLMLYYYREQYDQSTGTKESIQDAYARIYRLDLASGTYDGFVRVPEEGRREVRVGARTENISSPAFELIGVTSTDHFVLLRYEDGNRFFLLIVDQDGKAVKRWHLTLEDSELTYRLIGLDSSGLLYGLMCGDYGADVVWWRSDRFFREERGSQGSS